MYENTVQNHKIEILFSSIGKTTPTKPNENKTNTFKMDQPVKRFSSEQKSAGRKILTHFANLFRWVILLAQMQSGKSDAYMFTAFEMLREKKVKKVVILAGFQDKELVEQLKDYMPSLKLYRRYLQEELQLTFDEQEETIDMIPDNIKVICGSELAKTQIQQETDTLFIWDESHYAQNKINRPSKFMKASDISANGDISKLEGDRNNFFLSVSATPLSEISDTIHEEQPKKIVKMKPGNGYVSVGRLYRSKKIKPFKNWEKTLPECFEMKKKVPTPKYALVRIRGEKEMEKAIQMATAAGVDYEVYDSAEKSLTKKTQNKGKMQSFKDLEKAPSSHKVIFIRGMLRMGKRIPKTHISFVMETSKNAHTDVMLQGLLGRMCGYYTNDEIQIFVGENLVKKGKDGFHELDRYIKMMEDEEEQITLMPHKGTNLGGVKSSEHWFHAIPLVFRPSDNQMEERDDPDYERSAKDKFIAMCVESLSTSENSNGPKKTEEMLKQLNNIVYEDFNLHKFSKPDGSINDTFKDMPQLISEAVANDTPITKIPSGCGFGANDKPIVNGWFFNTNKYVDLGFPEGTFVLHCRTKTASDDELQQDAIDRAIPKTTKLEVFTSKQEDGTVVVGNGAYSIHAPVDSWNVPQEMQKYLEKVISISLMNFDGEKMPRCVVSNQIEGSSWQGIIVNAEVLKNLEKNGEITKYVKEKFGLRLCISRTRGKTPTKMSDLGQFRLAKIEW